MLPVGSMLRYAVLFAGFMLSAFAHADGLYGNDHGWAYGGGHSDDSPHGTNLTQKPPILTIAPKIGVSSLDISQLQALMADTGGHRWEIGFGLEVGYHDPSGLRLGIAGLRQSIGSSSSDYTAAFTGSYSITSYLVSALVGYDLFNFANRTTASATGGPGTILTLGPLLEVGTTVGTQIQGSNAYGENIQSASTSVPFGSFALSFETWRRGVPVQLAMRLGYRYFPALTFPNGTTQVSLSGPFLDCVIPISIKY